MSRLRYVNGFTETEYQPLVQNNNIAPAGHSACAVITKATSCALFVRGKMATPNKVAKRDAKNNHGMSQDQAGTLHFSCLTIGNMMEIHRS